MSVPGYWDDGPRELASWYVRDASVLDIPACRLRLYHCTSPFVGWDLPMTVSLDTLRDLELGWTLDTAEDVAILSRVVPGLHSLEIHVDDHAVPLLLPAIERCRRLRVLKLFVARRSFSAAAAFALLGAVSASGCRLTSLEFDPAPEEDVLLAFAKGHFLETSACLRGMRILRLNMWTADLDDLCDAMRELQRCCAARRVHLEQVFFDS